MKERRDADLADAFALIRIEGGDARDGADSCFVAVGSNEIILDEFERGRVGRCDVYDPTKGRRVMSDILMVGDVQYASKISEQAATQRRDDNVLSLFGFMRLEDIEHINISQHRIRARASDSDTKDTFDGLDVSHSACAAEGISIADTTGT